MRNEGVPRTTVYLYSMGQEFPNHWVAIHITSDLYLFIVPEQTSPLLTQNICNIRIGDAQNM